MSTETTWPASSPGATGVHSALTDRSGLAVHPAAQCPCVSASPIPVRSATNVTDVDSGGDAWGFVAPAVHQLRTPLTSILSFADLLLAGRGGESDRAEWMGHIRSQALRMKASLNSFLSIAEIETGRMVLRPTRVDVEGVFRELVRVTEAVAPGVRFHVDVAPDGRWVRADEPRFREIVWNLVDNAVKYSAGGGAITIASSASGGGMVQIEVSDKGAGIPPDRVPGLFKPFHRATGPRGAKGTGLGLYIVKTLAEMHGGSVSVSTTPGEGTTFRILLPAAEGEGQQPGIQLVDARPAATSATGVRPVEHGDVQEGHENDADSDFMRWISYELRAPLTPLLAAAELLSAPAAPEARKTEWLRRIRSLAVRMKCVTDATMTASHLRSGQISFEARPFDLAVVFASVIGQTAPLLEGHRINMTADSDARDVLGDQQRISDVLSALVESAVRECSDDSDIVLNAHRVAGSDRVAACVTFVSQQAGIQWRAGGSHRPGLPSGYDRPTVALGLRVASQLAQLQGGLVEICAGSSGATSYRVTLGRS